MSQKNALLEASCARSDASVNCDSEQVCVWQSGTGFKTCISANPPPAKGSITFCAGNASTPNMSRRMSLKVTSRKLGPADELVEFGSKITALASDRKNDCSYATYSAV